LYECKARICPYDKAGLLSAVLHALCCISMLLPVMGAKRRCHGVGSGSEDEWNARGWLVWPLLGIACIGRDLGAGAGKRYAGTALRQAGSRGGRARGIQGVNLRPTQQHSIDEDKYEQICHGNNNDAWMGITKRKVLMGITMSKKILWEYPACQWAKPNIDQARPSGHIFDSHTQSSTFLLLQWYVEQNWAVTAAKRLEAVEYQWSENSWNTQILMTKCFFDLFPL
jgi:hypothetical protein